VPGPAAPRFVDHEMWVRQASPNWANQMRPLRRRRWLQASPSRPRQIAPHRRPRDRRRTQEIRPSAVRMRKRSGGWAARQSVGHPTAPRLMATRCTTNSKHKSATTENENENPSAGSVIKATRCHAASRAEPTRAASSEVGIGSRTVNLEPTPSRLSTKTSPWCKATTMETKCSPTPVPAMPVALLPRK
jgi:hypothetical protein